MSGNSGDITERQRKMLSEDIPQLISMVKQIDSISHDNNDLCETF